MIVLNHKMAKSYQESIFWMHENKLNLLNLSKKTGQEIIICLSFDALAEAVKIFEETTIKIGAQNCSSYNLGAYTGEVAAISLKEMGVDYCIIGHSERRNLFGETNQDIANKFKLLNQNNIAPIVCIGETQEEKENRMTFEVISSQLDLLMEVIAQNALDNFVDGDLLSVARPNKKITELIIAYEPVWAIGTNQTPDAVYVSKIIAWLNTYFNVAMPGIKTKILYGGSIDPETAKKFSKVNDLSGFLLGRASLDFQTIEKIVLSK